MVGDRVLDLQLQVERSARERARLKCNFTAVAAEKQRKTPVFGFRK